MPNRKLKDMLRGMPLFMEGPPGDGMWPVIRAPQLWDAALSGDISPRSEAQIYVPLSHLLPWLRSIAECRETPPPLPREED